MFCGTQMLFRFRAMARHVVVIGGPGVIQFMHRFLNVAVSRFQVCPVPNFFGNRDTGSERKTNTKNGAHDRFFHNLSSFKLWIRVSRLAQICVIVPDLHPSVKKKHLRPSNTTGSHPPQRLCSPPLTFPSHIFDNRYKLEGNRNCAHPSALWLFIDSRTSMKFGVIIFPGSNCDHDAYWTIQQVAKQPVTFLWHDSHDLQNCDAIVVPGGFAFGDYLRTGAIAKFSPVMESVRKFADRGGLVLGICNGFQILCESGLLPGALMRNVGLKYVCKPVTVRVENNETPFTSTCRQGEVLTIPIGHMEGNYFCDDATLAELKRDNRIVFRYTNAKGEITPEANPNGSLEDIAGICSPGRNVLGMMPHPERSAEPELGGIDGFKIFESLVGAIATK
jgi:phosphoribosylformylglycinamidine synthase subunit PurQ / glutaminase